LKLWMDIISFEFEPSGVIETKESYPIGSLKIGINFGHQMHLIVGGKLNDLQVQVRGM
jgi:hypothetical protein